MIWCTKPQASCFALLFSCSVGILSPIEGNQSVCFQDRPYHVLSSCTMCCLEHLVVTLQILVCAAELPFQKLLEVSWSLSFSIGGSIRYSWHVPV